MQDTARPPRLAGWEAALEHVLAFHQSEPFAWGRSDCIVQIADAEKAMTGHDRMGEVRGSYTSAAGATRARRAAGYRSLPAMLAANFEECPPALARRGDCGLVRVQHGKRTELAAVLVVGAFVQGKAVPAYAGADSGRVFLPRSRLVKAYRIG
jgi:hypothetical protein